jgi:hypothetical protein
MSKLEHQEQFLGLWRRALQLPSLSDLSVEKVACWCAQRGLAVVSVECRDVGAFQPTRCIVVTTEGGAACLPTELPSDSERWQINRANADQTAALWAAMEWFSPLWIAAGKVQELLAVTRYRQRADAVKLFDYHMSTSYTLAFQAVCIAQLIPRARSLSDFAPLAREAYLAFYSGHRASSIAALVPAVEGALRKMIPDQPLLTMEARIDKATDGACALAGTLHFDGMWVPREYLTIDYLFGQDERVFLFETFRRWLKESFFRRTGEYDGVTWLNRHVYAHGEGLEWQQSTNFTRLVVALATLGVLESWYQGSHRVSLMLPEMNDDSRLLWQQALLRGHLQANIQVLEQEQFQKHGRLVPELPTDGGVTLRAAALKEDCIRDLVRPLRDSGWSVTVEEPDARALYMRVVAHCGEARLEVALLFSCATSNEIYRDLAQTANAILYRGAPYHQDQYAYGITVHVGPVTGWQPPRAPDAPC